METAEHKRSKKRKAAAFAVGAMGFRYSVVGARGKYQAQAGLLRRDYKMLRGGANELGHEFRGLPKGAQIAIGAAGVGGAGYLAYKHRAQLKRGAQWVRQQPHEQHQRDRAAMVYGTSLFSRGVPKITHGIRNRNKASFAYGTGQVVTGAVIVGRTQRQKRRRKLNG